MSLSRARRFNIYHIFWAMEVFLVLVLFLLLFRSPVCLSFDDAVVFAATVITRLWWLEPRRWLSEDVILSAIPRQEDPDFAFVLALRRSGPISYDSTKYY